MGAGVGVMVRRFRQARTVMRPWIATAAAFALALQVLLGGILATQAEASAALTPDSPFEICLGNGGAAPSDHGTDKAPGKHLQCVLCTLAKLSHAIVPTGEPRAFDVRHHAAVVFPAIERVAQFHSPTGHYQRGPPATLVG